MNEREVSKKVNVPLQTLQQYTQDWITREFAEDDLICEGYFSPDSGTLYLEVFSRNYGTHSHPTHIFDQTMVLYHKSGPVYEHIKKDFHLIAFQACAKSKLQIFWTKIFP